MANTDDYLQMNGIQHYMFCRRQWGLINIEQLWKDNEATMIGNIIHENADNPYYEEKRRNKIIIRSVPVVSHRLKLNGLLDVLELTKSNEGVPVAKHDGLWLPLVIEYKKGKPKKDIVDIAQLVAEVMAVEEMLGIALKEGAIYYKTPNKRQRVEITDELRMIISKAAAEMYEDFKRGKISEADQSKKCSMCSLVNECMPRLSTHKRSVVNYIKKFAEDEL